MVGSKPDRPVGNASRWSTDGKFTFSLGRLIVETAMYLHPSVSLLHAGLFPASGRAPIYPRIGVDCSPSTGQIAIRCITPWDYGGKPICNSLLNSRTPTVWIYNRAACPPLFVTFQTLLRACCDNFTWNYGFVFFWSVTPWVVRFIQGKVIQR